MNKSFLISGIVLVAIGITVYVISSQTDLLGGRTHHTIPLGGIGLTVLGALIIAGAAMMQQPGGKTANQFKCATCGAVFGSQTALDQHAKAKHGVQAAKS